MSEKPRSRTSARVASETRISQDLRPAGSRWAASVAPTLSAMRAVMFDMADPEFPASLADIPEPATPGPVVGPRRGHDRRDLRQRPPPVRPQHRAVAHPGLHRDLPLRARSRDGRAGRRGRGPTARLPSGRGWSSTPASRAFPAGSTRPAPTAPAAGPPPASTWTAASSARGGRSGTPRTWAGGGPRACWRTTPCSTRCPTRIEDRGASLYEPVSIACHGLMRAMPVDGEPVLIVGAGIIGLASLAALRGLFPHCPVTVLARHPHQADAALACGADHVVFTDPDNGHWEELASLSGAACRRPQAPPDADGRVPLRH